MAFCPVNFYKFLELRKNSGNFFMIISGKLEIRFGGKKNPISLTMFYKVGFFDASTFEF